MNRSDLTHLTLLLTLIGASLLRALDIYPIIYEPILFIYTLFIPGVLLLLILKKTELPTSQFILYSAGLSIAIIEITGVLTNFILPPLHIKRPLSEPYILGSFTIIVLILIITSWFVTRRHNPTLNIFPKSLRIQSLSELNILLALILIPLLTTTAVVVLNLYHTTILLYIAFLYILAFIPLALKLPPRTYPLLAFFMSLGLLYHTSLISEYLWGRDIFNEFYIVNLVISHGRWIPSAINDPLNSALSITILPLYFSNILNMSVVYVFKIVYPLVFALSSAVLYELYSTFFKRRIAIFSVFLLIFSITYYAEIPQMARVMIAELFLALFLLSLFANNDYKFSVVFGVFLMLSHYSTFYFIFFELIILAILIIALNRTFSKWQLLLLASFSLLSIGWFTSTSRGFVLMKVEWYVKAVLTDTALLLKYLLWKHGGLMETSPLHIATMPSPPLMKITKWLYALIVVFLTIGIFSEIGFGRKIKHGLKSMNRRYMSFYLLGFVNLGLVGALILIPPIARSITSTRVFHLVLFTSSPFVLVGIEKTITWIPSFRRHAYKIMAAGLTVFLILSSGALASFTKTPYDDTSIAFQSNDDWAKFTTGEIYAAEWIDTFWNQSGVTALYADVYGWVLPGAFNWLHCSKFPPGLHITKTAYIFLRNWNLKEKSILVGGGRVTGGRYLPISKLSSYLDNKIYDDGIAEVYLYVYNGQYLNTEKYCKDSRCVGTR